MNVKRKLIFLALWYIDQHPDTRAMAQLNFPTPVLHGLVSCEVHLLTSVRKVFPFETLLGKSLYSPRVLILNLWVRNNM